MSKGLKLIITTISIVILIVLIVFIYAFFDARNNNQTVGESIRNLFPVSGDSGVNPNPETNTGNPGTPPPEGGDVVSVVPNTPNKLTQISSDPVSGAMFSSTSTVRFIEKATGNVYEYSFFNKTSRKITNTTILKLHDSIWVNKDTFVGRYLAGDNSTVKTFVGSITKPGELGVVNTIFLRDNIRHITLAGENVFYVADVALGSGGFIYNPRTNKTTQIFISNLSELTPLWHNDTPFVYTNPSFNVAGVLFGISNGNLFESLNKIPAGIMSSVGDDLIISSFSSEKTTFNYNTVTGDIDHYISTLVPEKCVSLLDTLYCAIGRIPQNFPDSWFIGESTFDDHIYEVEKDTGRILVYSFSKEIEQGIDIINISTSPDQEQILFMNKKDNSLWSLDLSQN